MKDVAELVRKLRDEFGDQAEVHTAEPHKDGVHWHGHMAIGRYIPHKRLEALWGHGFVHLRKFTNRQSPGGGKGAAVRAAAGYVAKYVGKSYELEGGAGAGRHRYEVAQGYQPVSVSIAATSLEGFVRRTWAEVKQPVGIAWSSNDLDEWRGPPVVVLGWEVRDDDQQEDRG
jgi:hypothetical protein